MVLAIMPVLFKSIIFEDIGSFLFILLKIDFAASMFCKWTFLKMNKLSFIL